MKSWEDIPGWFDFGTAYEDAVAHFPDGSLFVEVGCYLGRSLCFLAQHAKAVGKSFRIIGVEYGLGSGVENGRDHHAEAIRAGGGSLVGTLHRNLIECGVADMVDLIVAPSVRAAAMFAPGAVDFVYLDAQHTREAVAADILAWLPRVRPGGWLGGDDLCPIWPGVQQAVADLLPGYRPWSHDSWKYEVK